MRQIGLIAIFSCLFGDSFLKRVGFPNACGNRCRTACRIFEAVRFNCHVGKKKAPRNANEVCFRIKRPNDIRAIGCGGTAVKKASQADS